MIADWIAMLSITIVGIGCYMIYPPLGLIVPGVTLFGIAVLAIGNGKK